MADDTYPDDSSLTPDNTSTNVTWTQGASSVITALGKAYQGVLQAQQGVIVDPQGRVVAVGGRAVENYNRSGLSGVIGGMGIGTLIIIGLIVYLLLRK